MIVLVPVSKFRINYEVASGRPYSRFEQLMLRAVAEGVSTLEDLQQSFEVHPRLIIEALVTLSQAGWIAVGGSETQRLLLTRSGQDALNSGGSPTSLVVTSRRAFVVMERINGTVLANRDVGLITRRDLGDAWDDALRMRAEVTDNSLDEGQVQHLLPKGRGDWVRWTGPIEMMNKSTQWLALDVDIDNRQVVGLPGGWDKALRSPVMDAAKRFASYASANVLLRGLPEFRSRRIRTVDSVLQAKRIPGSSWKAKIGERDILATSTAQKEMLLQMLENARSSLFIASPDCTSVSVQEIANELREALKRGVDIDVLWGGGDRLEAGGAELPSLLARIQREAKTEQWKGALKFNKGPSPNKACFVLGDSTPEGFEALVGTQPILTERELTSKTRIGEIAVRLESPGALSALSLYAAARFSDGPSEALSSTTDRWRRIAAEIDQRLAEESAWPELGSMEVSVTWIYDRQHEAILRDLAASTQVRFYMGATRTGTDLQGISERLRAIVSMSTQAPVFTIVPDLPSTEGRLADFTLQPGATVLFKGILADTTVCLSTYPYLEIPSSSVRKDLGILLDGPEAAGVIAQLVSDGVSEAEP